MMSDSIPAQPTQSSSAAAPVVRRPKFSPWALLPVGLLVGLMTIQIVMLMISTNDPGFAVEPDYYQKAVNWDEQQAELRRSAALGWETKLSVAPPSELGQATLSVNVNDRRGIPLGGAQVLVSAFHNARAAQVHELQLSETSDGHYAGVLQARRPGIWEFRLRVLRDGQTFLRTQQLELPTFRAREPVSGGSP